MDDNLAPLTTKDYDIYFPESIIYDNLASLTTKDYDIYFPESIIRNNSTLTATTALNTLGGANEVTLRWIPAHCGYEGNELADLTAKRGSKNNNATIVLLPIQRCICYAALRSRTKTCWSESFKQDSLRLFGILWREKFAKELIKMNRKDLRVATQILTGHAALNCLTII